LKFLNLITDRIQEDCASVRSRHFSAPLREINFY